MMLRVGLGFDSHRIVDGPGRVVIGGVVVSEGMRVVAHSDGDVLIHAIIDAVLGASGLGDIGSLFPDSDTRYKDADSSRLLSVVWERVKAKGFNLVNLDAVVISDRFMVSRFREKIVKSVSGILGVDRSRVWIKGKRPEGAFSGDGVSSICVVLLEGLG